MSLEYTHNDDVADMIYVKDLIISDLRKQVSKLQQHLDYVRTELDRVEREHARGF
jgi:hypothetical protein